MGTTEEQIRNGKNTLYPTDGSEGNVVVTANALNFICQIYMGLFINQTSIPITQYERYDYFSRLQTVLDGAVMKITFVQNFRPMLLYTEDLYLLKVENQVRWTKNLMELPNCYFMQIIPGRDKNKSKRCYETMK